MHVYTQALIMRSMCLIVNYSQIDTFILEKNYAIVYYKLHLNTNSMVEVALKLLTTFNLVVSLYIRINMLT